jgi:FKBP-type peptidyl-prolyl cis-trans isomerase FklB
MRYLAIGLICCAVISSVRADDKGPLTDKKDKLSYSMGYNIATQWKRQGIEPTDVDLDTLIRAMRDAFAGHDSLINDKDNREVINSFRTEMNARMQEKRKVQGEKNKKEGEAFLTENKTKPEVKTLPDGLQYKVLTEGTGPKPTTNDMVTVNYRGTLIDGTEFDSSYKRGQPSTFRVTGVIKGWTEALQMMPTGSKWQLFIPSDLAYGERGSGMNIGPNATLIFEIELISIQPQETKAVTLPSPQPVTSDIIKVPSAEELKKGAKIEIIKQEDLDKQKTQK